ncbi:MAG: four-carbon acid sugar kinase family protein [Nitrospinales bacterium]
MSNEKTKKAGSATPILVSFYGDDFTGTAATAEALTQSGLPTIIFTDPPSPSYLAKHFPRAKAVGISGATRTLPAQAITRVLTPIFLTLKAYQSPIYVYKVCSTFDSSENIGNIGRAIELGKDTFSSDFIPILPAALKIGRYTVFGIHFAAVGDGEVFRLDRHPSMANHPVTPMGEADLRKHLANQTELRSGLINILEVREGPERIKTRIDELIAAGVPIIFFDCLSDRDLNTICETVFKKTYGDKPLFFVGSQELGYGLTEALKKTDVLSTQATVKTSENMVSDRGPILVISGSCATITGEQIFWSKDNGFYDIPINPPNLLDPTSRDQDKEQIVTSAINAVAKGKSVILHTAIGPDDERIATMNRTIEKLSLAKSEANEILGTELGGIAHEIISGSFLKRIVICGGDTAGRIQKMLQVEALQISKSIGIAAPLCYVYSKLPQINGLEIAFKGGQIGRTDYFSQARCQPTLNFKAAALGYI